jgi:hypothetical protein
VTYQYDPDTQQLIEVEGGIIYPLGRTVDDIIYWVKQD